MKLVTIVSIDPTQSQEVWKDVLSETLVSCFDPELLESDYDVIKGEVNVTALENKSDQILLEKIQLTPDIV